MPTAPPTTPPTQTGVAPPNRAPGSQLVVRPTRREMAWAIVGDVNRTLGGGLASMELLRRRFERAKWLTFEEHALLVAVSRLTPGTNILAYCAALGWLCHRAAGAVLALLASSVPGALIVIALSAALVRVDQWPLVQGLLAVAMLAASTLVFSTAWHLLRPYLSSRRSWALASVAVVSAMSLAGATPVRVLLLAAAWGALTPTATRASTPIPEREESA